MRKSLLWFLFSLQGFLVVVQAKSFVHAMFNFTKRKCSASTGTIDKLHILRVPKASSSVLSVVARRAVGCVPAGPCCKFPGDPPGSCPSEELFTCQKERRVLGCTNHYSNYPALLNPNMTSISIMREPIARSISAYFYPGTHHNSNCTQNQDQCFLQYLQNPQWQNVVVKMLTGQHAYSTLPTCRYKSQCSHSLELARENLDHVLVFGVADMWELSLMLIHCKLRHINPIFEEFKLGLRTGNTTGERINTKIEYIAFANRATVKFRAQLVAQNELDIELYHLVLRKLWKDLNKLGLLDDPLVQEYWKAKMSIKI